MAMLDQKADPCSMNLCQGPEIEVVVESDQA